MVQDLALEILKSGANVFLTGEPGSGKTYLLNRYIKYLRSCGVEPSVTASTGIAATHIGGMTIHSWSGIGIKNKPQKSEIQAISRIDYINKRISKAKILIIDEISMLSADTLQSIEAICRTVRQDNRPFGGMQIVLVGDFFQLPPVAEKTMSNSEELFREPSNRFAFNAEAWQRAELTVCYLTEQHRQKDNLLMEILSQIRKNLFDFSMLDHLRDRLISGEPPCDLPSLYTHNENVDYVNEQKLKALPGQAQQFIMRSKGRRQIIEIMKKGCLSPERLFLKAGAQVMFTKNNPREGYVNGTLGEVAGFDEERQLPVVSLKNGRKILVDAMEWTLEEEGKVKGWLSQVPLRLAWAMTVHKSQGVSLDGAVIDLSRVFEFGQGYVALSRVRSLSGLHLLGWNERAFKVDESVCKYDQELHRESMMAERIYNNIKQQKFKQIQDEFIVSCGGKLYADGKAVLPPEKDSTYEITLKLWRQHRNIAKIATERGFTESTVIGHLEKLFAQKKISADEIREVVPRPLQDNWSQIQAAFLRQTPKGKLSPVYKYFNGCYAYSDLRLARLLLP